MIQARRRYVGDASSDVYTGQPDWTDVGGVISGAWNTVTGGANPIQLVPVIGPLYAASAIEAGTEPNLWNDLSSSIGLGSSTTGTVGTWTTLAIIGLAGVVALMVLKR